MKNIITVLAVVGLFSVFTISCKEKCAKKCCQTEVCKTQCIDNKCCTEGKTCDVTGDENCKHKCCSTDKETCDIKGEEKSCCKTK